MNMAHQQVVGLGFNAVLSRTGTRRGVWKTVASRGSSTECAPMRSFRANVSCRTNEETSSTRASRQYSESSSNSKQDLFVDRFEVVTIGGSIKDSKRAPTLEQNNPQRPTVTTKAATEASKGVFEYYEDLKSEWNNEEDKWGGDLRDVMLMSVSVCALVSIAMQLVRMYMLAYYGMGFQTVAEFSSQHGMF